MIFSENRNVKMLPEQNNLLNDLTFENVAGVAEQVMKSFTSGNLTGWN